MHMVIRILTYASSAEEAVRNAVNILDNQLCSSSGLFDWYTTFDDETATTSGKARWGELPPAVKADSELGMKLIREGIMWTWDSFLESLRHVKNWIENADITTLFEDRGEHRDKYPFDDYGLGFRYACYCLGQYSGPEIWIYDNDGEGIRDTKHLLNVLNKWQCIYDDLSDADAHRLSQWDYEHNQKKTNPYIDLDVWVVPVDVHH